MGKTKLITLNIKLPDHFWMKKYKMAFSFPKRKEVWAVELDLLTEFDRVCKKYKLRYFADGRYFIRRNKTWWIHTLG